MLDIAFWVLLYMTFNLFCMGFVIAVETLQERNGRHQN